MVFPNLSDGRSQTMLGTALLALAALAWCWTAHEAGAMNCVMTMPEMQNSRWTGCALYVLSWTTMMVAMMLPAVTPMVLLFARIARTRRSNGSPWLFVGGYLIVWGLFAIPAYFATLEYPAIAHSAATLSLAPQLPGAVLLLAGLYQLSAFKNACLRHCTAPLDFVMHRWRDGMGGALLMGTHHAIVCVACCSALMIVLFTLGVMSLKWMAVIAGCMAAERFAGHGRLVSRFTGATLVAIGLAGLFLPSAREVLLRL